MPEDPLVRNLRAHRELPIVDGGVDQRKAYARKGNGLRARSPQLESATTTIVDCERSEYLRIGTQKIAIIERKIDGVRTGKVA